MMKRQTDGQTGKPLQQNIMKTNNVQGQAQAYLQYSSGKDQHQGRDFMPVHSQVDANNASHCSFSRLFPASYLMS